jgi:POT family proton-dependent oligopeptide transporter
LVVGNGFFKPNISSLVGALYPPNDSRRDAGFTIFYMSINIGALISPLICGYLAEKYGWHFGFSLAGIGMLVGTIFFYRGAISGAFESEGLPATTNTAQTLFGIKYEYLVYLFSLLLIPTAMYLLVNAENMKWLLNSILIAVVTYLTYMLWGLANIERQRLLVVIILTISATTFWAFFEQAGSSLTLYADKNVNLIGINASQTNSINPLFIIAFAIPFSILWTYLSKRKNNPITPIKFGLAHLGLGIGFGFLAYSAQFMDEAAKVPMLFFIIGNLFITIGELCISPVGLSKITELTPKKLVSFMMGVWFLSVSFAHHIAGIVAKLTTQKLDLSEDSFSNTFITQITGITAKTLSENPIENLQSLAAYTSIFAQIALIAFAFALLTFALSPLLKKMMHGIN